MTRAPRHSDGSRRCSVCSPKSTRSWSRGSTGFTSTSNPGRQEPAGGPGSRRRAPIAVSRRVALLRVLPGAGSASATGSRRPARMSLAFARYARPALGNVGPAKPVHSAKKQVGPKQRSTLQRTIRGWLACSTSTTQLSQQSLAQKFSLANKMAIPKLEKIVINMGVGQATRTRQLTRLVRRQQLGQDQRLRSPR